MSTLARLLAAGLCLAAATTAVHAQRTISSSGSGSATTARTAPSASPNPAGLRPYFPAGISSGSGAAVSGDPIARANSPVPAGSNPPPTTTTTGGGTVVVPTELFPNGTVGPNTTVLGAGAVVPNTSVMGAGATVPGPSQYLGSGAGGFAAADTARSFFFADANHDGELTRAEARRLSIATMSFEEMDRNFDGIISRFEYDDSVR